jgi:hypothetical protein
MENPWMPRQYLEASIRGNRPDLRYFRVFGQAVARVRRGAAKLSGSAALTTLRALGDLRDTPIAQQQVQTRLSPIEAGWRSAIMPKAEKIAR